MELKQNHKEILDLDVPDLDVPEFEVASLDELKKMSNVHDLRMMAPNSELLDYKCLELIASYMPHTMSYAIIDQDGLYSATTVPALRYSTCRNGEFVEVEAWMVKGQIHRHDGPAFTQTFSRYDDVKCNAVATTEVYAEHGNITKIIDTYVSEQDIDGGVIKTETVYMTFYRSDQSMEYEWTTVDSIIFDYDHSEEIIDGTYDDDFSSYASDVDAFDMMRR